MTRTVKKALTVFLSLCLIAAWLPTAALAAEATTVTASQAQAGVELTKITLTAANGSFAETQEPTYYTFSAQDSAGVNIKVTGATQSSNSIVELTVEPFTPTKSANFTITIDSNAFDSSTPTGESISTTFTIAGASPPNVTAAVTSELKAGKDGGEVKLTINGGNNAFVSNSASGYSIRNNNNPYSDLEIASVTAEGKEATLTFTGKPTAAVNIKVLIPATAFQFQPATGVGTAIATTNEVPIQPADAPAVTASADGELNAGTEGTINLSITGEDNIFVSSPGEDLFTVKVGETEQTVTDAGDGGGASTKLTFTPSKEGAVSVEIMPGAFTYQPEKNVTATCSITVSAPAVTASVTDTPLTVGKEGDIIVTAIGSPFVSGLENADYFTLSGGGLGSSAHPTSVSVSDNTATLKVTPTESADITVTSINKAAFQYQPATDVTLSGSNIVTVNAPTVILSGDSIVAGKTDKVIVKISSDNAKFASGDIAGNFSVTGTGISGIGVKSVTVTDSGSDAITAEITLTAVPAEAGTLQFEVQKNAFTPVAFDKVTVDIDVTQPTGSVSGALAAGGSLTAGTNAAGVKITLTAGDDLRFQSSASQSDFTLNDGSEGLSIESVEVGSDGTTATLTLSGIPAKGGSFTVTALQAAFVASPGEDKTTTDSITIGYPSITLTVDPNYLAEEDDTVHAFTLKADGGTFKTPAVLGDFSFSGDITGITLNGVSADGDTATLTFTGSATSTGKLTITVKPTAFQYQPKSDVLATVTVGQPSGTLSAAPNGTLYAGTAADGVTITVDITESQGLHFKQDMQPSDFTLTGSATGGLTIQKVEFVSTTQAVLTLSGTPTTAGTFQVQAETGAFHMAPGAAITAEGDITVNAANVTITVDKNELQAGEADKTFSLNVTGAKFSSPSGKVSIDSQGSITSQLAVGQVTGGDASVTVTVTGKPDIAGDLTVKITKDAFEPQPDEDVTVTVPVAKGEQKQEQQTETGAPGIKSDTPLDKLAGAVLTPEELAKFNAGAEVIITLKEEALGDQVPADDKQAVEAVAAGYTVGDYLDVSLYKQINGGPETPVETTSSAIRVVFTIPENLRAANREYVVARVHDNTATILKPVAATDTTITVETNQFSTYAILYRTAVNTPTPTAAASDRAPDTGDDTLLPVWTVLLLGCGAALVPAVCVLRRRTHR